MKLALVHDYLSQDGGAEKVLEVFREIWPEAPIFVLFHDEDKIDQFDEEKIRESFLGNAPLIKSNYRYYLPLMPLATESYDFSEFDVVLSSTSAFAKGVLTDSDTLHISYCHTPTRYLWTETHDYISNLDCNFLTKKALPYLLYRLRMWDKMSVSRVDKFLTNSKTVEDRIDKFYDRNSEVFYPPVEVDQFSVSSEIGDYYLAGGRLVPYKRFEMVVKAFNRLGEKLKIFGFGPLEDKLKNQANENVEVLGKVSEEKKIDLFTKAKAFIHPQKEDFGLTAVESMASGRPVIAYNQGGATETVKDGTGVLFDRQNWGAILDTVRQFNPSAWSPKKISSWAKKFSKQSFKTELRKFVEAEFENFKSNSQQRETKEKILAKFPDFNQEKSKSKTTMSEFLK